MSKWNRAVCRRVAAASLVLSSMAIGLGGCWYVAAGAGAYAGYTYVNGEYKGVIKADLDDSVRATRAAFEDLEIREKSYEESATGATIEGVSTGNRGVRVKLEGAGDNATNVRVRVDTFGDKSFSQLVVDEINGNL